MLQFPSEIHGMIAEKCTQKDIASVARVCKQLYQTYQSYLYKVNIKFHESSAFWRIFRCCKPDVAVKALQNAINAGADIQHRIQHEVSFYHNNYKLLDLFTPLHIAVWNGNSSSVTCLIQNGADLNNQSCSFDLTPLMLALLRGREAIALNLLDHGAALTTSKFGDTPLHLAAERNFLDVIKYLVQNRGMDSNCQNIWGYTPLLCAVDSIYAKKEVIAYLCVHGADPTYSTTSAEHIPPLQKAIENSSWGIAEQLDLSVDEQSYVAFVRKFNNDRSATTIRRTNPRLRTGEDSSPYQSNTPMLQ
ncbi:ankyrin repeat-containing domain protein [Ustulina deusta]|nr:ankyrin repeat-containing domain protein [Ustulina deusta]